MRTALAVLLVLAAGGAGAQTSDLPPQDAPPVRFSVVIDAPRAYRRMFTEGLDIVRWQNDQRVTMALLERLAAEARKAAAEAMAAEGYFLADVRSEIETVKPGEAIVRLKVEPGQRTRVREVAIDVAGPAVGDAEGDKRITVVKEGWKLAPGQAFRQSAWDSAKQEALARLARGRYAAAKITQSEARIEPEASSAHLTLKLDSGPVFHAGALNVSGLKRYPASVVENLNPIKRGEPYDATTLDLYQRRLLETGYFNAVRFVVDPDVDQAAAAPLNINVIEGPSQRVDMGLQYTTDTGFGGSIDYSNVDIFGSAHRLRPKVNVNQKEQKASVSVDTPPRPGGAWYTYATRLEHRDIRGEDTREAVVSVARNWGLEATPTQVVASAHMEKQSVEGTPTENNHALYVGYRRTFRTTDDIVNPRRGVLGTAEIGAGVPGVSSRDFVRLHGKVNWLIPAGPRNDILVRGEAGTVLASTREGVVTSFLFRTGGDQTIRGYAYESIGVAQNGATVGGRYLALASVEFTRWVTDTLGAAVFVDAGDAFDHSSAFDLAVGIGLGIRWRSPIGPFRADIAYGERDEKLRLHFSVGYSF